MTRWKGGDAVIDAIVTPRAPVELHVTPPDPGSVPVSMSVRCKRCDREVRVFLERVVDSESDLDVVGAELVALMRDARTWHDGLCEVAP